MYLVQIGRYKSAYKTKYTLEKEGQAVIYYAALNVGNGYKKRLVDPSGKVVLREIT